MRAIAAAAGMVLIGSCWCVHAAELQVLVKDNHGKLVADAVILATAMDPKNALHARPPLDAVDQVDKQFVPYVKVVFVGSTIHFPNSDKVRHQVYSFSAAKKFELPLYAGSNAPPIVFDKAGLVVLGCNIHDWMIGYVYVADTPFFAKTEASGVASIQDMPPGQYSLRIWHPSMEHTDAAMLHPVKLTADSPTVVEYRLDVKPSYHVPRVSGSASPAYP